MVTGEQIRAARALLRIEQADLARLAGVSKPTVARLELTVGPIQATTRTAERIERALLQAGARLIPGDAASGPGVQLVAPLT